MALNLEGFGRKEQLISPEARLASFLSTESVGVNYELARLQEKVDPEGQVKLGEDFRILPPDTIYDDRDRESVDGLTAKFEHTEDSGRGDIFEQFITAILVKKLKGRYIVTRASLYDDYVNGVDNFLVDAKTGAVVCALDEVNLTRLANTDPRYIKKSRIVQDMNWGRRPSVRQNSDGAHDRDLRFGATVKYGIILKPGSSDGKVQPSVSCGPVANIPVFLISLDSSHIDDAIDSFEPDESKLGSTEDKLYTYFLATIRMQISAMRIKHQEGEDFDELPQIMISRIDDFDKFAEAELDSRATYSRTQAR